MTWLMSKRFSEIIGLCKPLGFSKVTKAIYQLYTTKDLDIFVTVFV